MVDGQPKNFNLPWHQHDRYWICFYAKNGEFSAEALGIMQKAGMHRLDDHSMAIATQRQWRSIWDKLYTALGHAGDLTNLEVALTPGETMPVAAERKSPEAIEKLAQSLWLGDALMEGRVVCYLQPVVSQRDKVFGYESFARVRLPDGSIIGGDKIVAASKVLGIEFVIDRHLQVEAIKTFITSEFDGFLFVNFFPGFIQRPAVYLEGLSETVKSYGIISKHIVLDFTKSESAYDLKHIQNVCEYGRSRGYSIALDDIESLEGTQKLLEIRPDFVKIDMKLVRKANEPKMLELIRQIVELVHAIGATVIGEGVETTEIHQALKGVGVDLFQGYFFSPPMPVEAALKKSLA
jgi:EAL domain-containing protein (putative c-di-GMP-specific phosphodiesterase class I)